MCVLFVALFLLGVWYFSKRTRIEVVDAYPQADFAHRQTLINQKEASSHLLTKLDYNTADFKIEREHYEKIARELEN